VTAPPSRHTHLDLNLAHGLWAEVPTLSWVAELGSGKLRFNAGHAGADGAPLSQPPDAAAWGASLRPHIEGNGARPFQVLEALPGPDGKLHHFLIVGFPFSGLVAAPEPLIGGVAIDITHYKLRLDELAQQALVDELTGLYNLRGFFLFAERELKVARRRGTTSAIVYVDVDGMKKINDTCGHEEGNGVLIGAATLLRKVFRECDIIARLGGDEFAIFVDDVRGDPDQLTRRLRSQLRYANLDSGDAADLTISIGVAACGPNADLGLTDLVTAADEAMYKDKNSKTPSAAAATAAAGTAAGGSSPS
jgi:diguanylate cyclase (GGDEF)-like protein